MKTQNSKIKNQNLNLKFNFLHYYKKLINVSNTSIYISNLMPQKPSRFLILILTFSFCLLPFSQTFAQSNPPTSSSYKLLEYGFGSGGTASSSSDNYSLFGTVGQVDQGSPSSENYFIGAGLEYTLQASVAAAPTFVNPANWYNKLSLTINPGGEDPPDTEYAVRIASGSGQFQYIQNDMTVGNSLGNEDWLTYSNWGGDLGTTIIGLYPNTLYTVQVAARQGQFFTQFMWSPSSSASTDTPRLSFDIDISSTDTETSSPYVLPIGDVAQGGVVTAPSRVWIDFETNGNNGGFISISGTNNGLTSTTVSHTINSQTADLTAQPDGYGARSATVGESSGGPMRALTPYDGTSNNVGVLDTARRYIYDSTFQPVTGGRVSFEIKAKASATTPSADDYTDILTVIATGSF